MHRNFVINKFTASDVPTRLKANDFVTPSGKLVRECPSASTGSDHHDGVFVFKIDLR
jgi:hypothetical protein